MTTKDAKFEQLSRPAPAPADQPDAEPPSEEPTDQALIRRIREGDETAFERLFDRYRQVVYAICLRVLRNESDAEETLVTVFWEVWSHPDRFDGKRGAFSTYIMMLARSRAIDHHRSRAARHRSGNGATPLEVDQERDPQAGPAEVFWLAERRKQVRDAMRSLGKAQREAVELSFFEGMSHQQIAERVGAPLGTIKTRIRLGLIRLRDSLRISSEEDAR